MSTQDVHGDAVALLHGSDLIRPMLHRRRLLSFLRGFDVLAGVVRTRPANSVVLTCSFP